MTKFATLGDFLVCRLSLHLHNIEIYRQRGLESKIVGYILLCYIKGFYVAVVEMQKSFQHPSTVIVVIRHESHDMTRMIPSVPMFWFDHALDFPVDLELLGTAPTSQ